jgi:hypothetical protein
MAIFDFSSRAGTTRTAGIPAWTMTRRFAMNNGTLPSRDAKAVHTPQVLFFGVPSRHLLAERFREGLGSPPPWVAPRATRPMRRA